MLYRHLSPCPDLGIVLESRQSATVWSPDVDRSILRIRTGLKQHDTRQVMNERSWVYIK
jgi:hypothetical protein